MPQQGLTWEYAFFAGIGAALIGGISAAVVARLTVWWTQRGDQRAARLRESRHAAEQLSRAAAHLLDAVVDQGDGSAYDILSKWLIEVSLQTPVLADEELVRRVDEVATIWGPYLTSRPLVAGWQTLDEVTGRYVPTDDRVAQLRRYKDAAVKHYHWVRDSLAAHRIGKALPSLADRPHIPPSPVDENTTHDETPGA